MSGCLGLGGNGVIDTVYKVSFLGRENILKWTVVMFVRICEYTKKKIMQFYTLNG